MSESDWTDLIAGERMQVDREFSEKVAASNFTSQQWGLIMTAVEFEIERPGDADAARLVADTSKLGAVMPELDRMEGRGEMAMGGGADAGSGGSSGGIFDGIKDALGIGGGRGDRERVAAAEELAQMYADDLQEKLQARGKWERVRQTAQE
ncbi:MAG: DUF5799 family protein [Haloarculaceae archaeon]